MKLSRWALAAAPLALAACNGFGSAMTAHTDVVATAAGKELRVEDAAQLLATNPQVPDNPDVVGALADLWVQYTLLATAFAEDTSLKVLNVEEFAAEQRDAETVNRYVESTVRADTSFTDAELAQLWNTEGPGVEVKARHILLMPPQGDSAAAANPAQRQALRQRAEQLRQRAANGEDFTALAAEATEEPGGKERGGDLGWFGRGRMVAQFEEAAFKLQPGQVSPVVETPFGYHVIKVEDRRQTPLGDNAAAFRQQAQQQARSKAFTAYVDSLKKAANITVRPDAVQQMKAIAQEGDLDLRGRAASRQLVTYRGGEFNAGELAEMLQAFPAGDLRQVKDAPEDGLKGFLEEQALRELLLNEARTHNFRLSATASDSINRDAREAIRQVLQMSGLAGRSFPRGKERNGAIQEAVRNLMVEAVAGQRRLPQLGKLGYALRSAYEADINEASFQRVIDRMKAIRASQPQQQMPGGMPPGGMPQGMPQGMPPQGGAAPQTQPAQPQQAPAQPTPPPAGEQAPAEPAQRPLQPQTP